MKLILNGTQTICSFEQINLEHSLMYSLFSSKNLTATLEAEILRIEKDIENLDGAIKAANKLDELIHLCRNSRNETVLLENIIQKYDLNHHQARYIMELDLEDVNEDAFQKQKDCLEDFMSFLKSKTI